MKTIGGITMKNKLKLNAPRWIFIQLLEHCNLRCKMCYEWGDTGSYKKKNELKQLDIKIVKKVIEECKAAQPFYELYGGEPLMYPWLDEVLETIKFYGSQAHLPTNGTLLEKQAEMLVRNELDSVWVSLDGLEKYNDIQRGEGVYQKAVNGMKKLYDIRESMDSQYPRIGTSTVITPFNHLHIEEYFHEIIKQVKLDYISFEIQYYVTQKEYDDYAKVLNNQFGIDDAPIARGFLRETEEFNEMDTLRISEQLKSIQEYCDKHNIYFNTYPKSIAEPDLNKFINADWHNMDIVKKRCPFPWVSAEINARGEVASCHSLYDLTYGNIYEQSLIEIWNNEKYNKFRKHMRKNLLSICPACCLFYNEKPGRK